MIRIVCYEDVHLWIFGKFALRMHENLLLLGKSADIAKQGTASAQVAHRIAYSGPNEKLSPVETLMITHLDTSEKIFYVKERLELYDMGICMSADHRRFLVTAGLPQNRLCYVNPAQDGVLKPRPIVFGIASKVHDDGRKNEWSIVKALKGFPPDFCILKIMGGGWEPQVAALRSHGITVEYYDQFDYEIYTKTFMPSLDYFLYFSHDEGSMAYLDAIAADVKVIATPQGFHLDIRDGIDHIVTDMHDVAAVFRKLLHEREGRTARVSGWTWLEYAWRHLVVWDYLTLKSSPDTVAEQSTFMKLLPSLDPRYAPSLLSEFVYSPVPDLDALLVAGGIAQKGGLANAAAQFNRMALVFYPKSEDAYEKVSRLYPSYLALACPQKHINA